LGGSHNNSYVGSLQVCRNMIYNNLLKLKDELGKKSLRNPRTADEILSRKKYERVMNILWKRYEYGIDVMEQYRYGDFRDEIAAVKR
jgi:hypothetical protein